MNIKTEIIVVDAKVLFEKIELLERLIRELEQASPIEEKLITRFEVAEMLGVSIVTVHNWVKSKRLKGYKMGNQVRFKQSEVFSALQEMQTK